MLSIRFWGCKPAFGVAFEKYGSVALVPPKLKNSGPSRDMVKNQLENLVSEFPQLSNKKATFAVGVSPTFVYHIFHGNMYFINQANFIYGKID